MSENKKLIPKRRFKEFQNTDAWEQRELGKFVSLITKGTTPRDKSGSGSINFIKVENISDGIISPVSKISEDEHEGYLQRSKLKENDTLISIAGTLGRTGVVDKTILPANTNQALAIIRGYDFDKDFLLTSLNGKAVKDFIRRNPTIGAQPNLSLEQVGKFLIYTPKKEEQIQIGVFFKNLDQTIAFQQRKLEKMKSMKSAYLSEMFPAAGERKPKRRFPGFTDDWKQCKLEDMCSLITKQTGFDYSATIKPSLINKKNDSTYSFIQNKDFSGFNINLNTDFYIPVKIAEKFPRILLDQPSLLVTISGKIGNLGLYNDVKKAFIGGAVGICKLNDLKEGEFILYELTSEFGQRQFRKSTKTSSHANITVEMIKDIDIIIPKNHIEHNKIFKFFKQLDTTIAFQQQKLEKLQNIKKAYLNEMFI